MARWNCIKEALGKLDTPLYFRRMVADYFSHRILEHDTEVGPKEYEITSGVSDLRNPLGLDIGSSALEYMMICLDSHYLKRQNWLPTRTICHCSRCKISVGDHVHLQQGNCNHWKLAEVRRPKAS